MKANSAFSIVLAVILLLLAGHAQAQQPDASESGDMSFFVAEAAKVKAESARLQTELAALQRDVEADPNRASRNEIQDVQRFLSDLRRLRSDGEKFAPVYLVRPLDWLAKWIDTRLAAKLADLKTREQALAKDRAGITRQIESKKQELAVNAALQQTVDHQIQDLRDERARASKASELDELKEEAEHSQAAPARSTVTPNPAKKPSKGQQ